MLDMNKTEMEQGAIEGIKCRIAEKVSDVLAGTAEKSKGLCVTLGFDEPVYPIELLMEE